MACTCTILLAVFSSQVHGLMAGVFGKKGYAVCGKHPPILGLITSSESGAPVARLPFCMVGPPLHP